ncbi:hypothetical protein ACK4CS_03220 [Enterococcus gallinarum]|uniref:Uncharacterized protein n=3 Tax=Enterococcus TaxID=1350 RepID=A0A6A8NF28_ENTFC|nr:MULTISPECIES: hypothetical protein [Enterococcus]EGO2664775.1 hypothetical protein [Enterococcus faecalis]EGO5248828.1 hypothetical protein [Enterococcus faecalis]EGO7733364.1 hypothetical protein [Enterococcus faecalis]EGO7847893.1 hypothetical protein [Enterococcus faecalis]EGO7953044.1 hypothetical protein [Enterococcus faecalis]
MINSEEIVHLIEDLNSISTFHRWRKMVEELCGVKFQKKVIRVGNSSYSKVYQFSEEDVKKFQQVADLKNKGHPLKEAIIKVFDNELILDSTQDQNVFDELKYEIKSLKEQVSKQAKHILDLERELRLTNYESSQLSQRIQKMEVEKADKFFHRKKS